MASERQVRNWIVECLRRHLSPDALCADPGLLDNQLAVLTRKPGSVGEPGDRFVVEVHALSENR